MGFGGAAAAMATTLKNNNRRKQRKAFDGFSTSTKDKSRVPVIPVSKEKLTKIKVKLQAENNALLKKRLIIFSSILIIILAGSIKLIFY